MRRPEGATPRERTAERHSRMTEACRYSPHGLAIGDRRFLRGTWSRVLATVFVATLALGVTVALAADITGSPNGSAVPRVANNAGEFEIANSSAGEAIVTADDVAPGSPAKGEVTITNSGDVAGPITLSTSDIIDEPGSAGGALTDIAEVTVNDVTEPQAPITVYAGRVVAMPDVALGTFAPDEARTYGFIVSLPDAAAGSDDINAYQSASLRFGYVWTGKAGDTPGASVPPVPDPPPTESSPVPDRTPTESPPVPDRTPTESSPVPDRSPSDSPSRPDDGQASPSDAPSDPGAGSSPPAPQAPAAAAPAASRTPDRQAHSDRTKTTDRRSGRRRDRGPQGSAAPGRDTPAAKDRRKRSALESVIETLKQAVTATAEKGSFPLLLLLMVAAFFRLQHWLDRRDPKLALAPVDAEPTRTFD